MRTQTDPTPIFSVSGSIQIPEPPAALSRSLLFRSDAPIVQLLHDESTAHPFAVTIAAAWSCYGAKPARDNVLKLVYGPGPAPAPGRLLLARTGASARSSSTPISSPPATTPLQHATFVFVLDNVSRLAIWSFFHSPPVLQLGAGLPALSRGHRRVDGDARSARACSAIYDAAIQRSFAGYRRLTEILTPDFAARYGSVFPARVKGEGRRREQRVADAVQKRAQEVARYVLPLATPAHLYHTVNGLTLLRYHVLANQPDAPAEVRYIVDRMVGRGAGGRSVLPRRAGLSARSPRRSAPKRRWKRKRSASWRRTSGAIDRTMPRRSVTNSMRTRPLETRLGVLQPGRRAHDGRRDPRGARRHRRLEAQDDEAIAQVLDGASNPYLGHPLYLGMHSKLMQTMNHVPFTFQKRISGAEDAQNQRHRGTPSFQPAPDRASSAKPDVIVPWAIRQNPAALAEYNATIRRCGDAKNALLDPGVAPEAALYLLPNSARVRFYESGTLLELLLEVDQAALLRRPAGDLRNGRRGGRAGARGACRPSAVMSMARPA